MNKPGKPKVPDMGKICVVFGFTLGTKDFFFIQESCSDFARGAIVGQDVETERNVLVRLPPPSRSSSRRYTPS